MRKNERIDRDNDLDGALVSSEKKNKIVIVARIDRKDLGAK